MKRHDSKAGWVARIGMALWLAPALALGAERAWFAERLPPAMSPELERRVAPPSATPPQAAATAAAGVVSAEIQVVAIPAQILVRPTYATYPDGSGSFFCSYSAGVTFQAPDGSTVSMDTCENFSPVNTLLPPEQGLRCIAFVNNVYQQSGCHFSIDRSRNVYRLSMNVDQAAAYNQVSGYNLYTTGQVFTNSSGGYSIPTRYDVVASTPISGGAFSTSDPSGDLLTGYTCGPCYNTAALDAGMDVVKLSGTFTAAVSYSGVKLDVAASVPGPVKSGDTFSYTFTLRNDSTAAIGGGSIKDVLPVQLAYRTASCGSYGADGFVWTLPAVQAGASVSCVLAVRVASIPQDGAITNTATAIFQFAGGPAGSATGQQQISAVRPAQPQVPTVSGAPTTQNSVAATLSSDGKLLAFSSADNGYLANDKNGANADIYLVDRRTGALRLVSVAEADGSQLPGSSDSPKLSGNGQAVAFVYRASTNAALHGGQAAAVTATTATICVSPPNGLFRPKCLLGNNGQPINGSAEGPSLSADGRYMAFCSSASNIPGTTDTNGRKDVFVLDQTLGQVKLVSTTTGGAQGNGDSCEAMISGDGKSVVFTSVAQNFGTSGSFREVFKKDLASNALSLVSRGVDGNPATSEAVQPSVSYDGRRITFVSRAANLASGVSSAARYIWVYDDSGSAGTSNKLDVVRGAGGVLPNNDSEAPAISCNGRIVAFDTRATNLSPPDTNNVADVYLYDVDNKVVRRAVAPQAGVEPNGGSGRAVLDCEGNTLAFESEATNLSPGDPNSNDDIYGQEAPLRSDAAGVSVDATFSGNWYNPGNDGHGFLIEALSLPGTPFYVTWYVFKDGQPIFLQGVANAVGNTLTVDMTTAKSTAFPVGAGGATNTSWGKVKLTFTDADTGTAQWTPTAAGFSAGNFNLRRLTTPALIQSDAGQTIKACYSGIWAEPARPGYGLDLEVNDFSASSRLLTVYWYTYQPNGAPLWLVGVGSAANGKISVDLYQSGGAGAKFPPNYAKAGTTSAKWGTATLQFSGSDAASLSWTSATSGYSNGSASLKRLTSLATRGCQ